MVRIIIYGIIFLGFAIILIAFVPYRLWKLRLSFLWWILLIIIFSLICVSFTQIYPINSTIITFRKAFFSILTGSLLFCFVWSVNSFEKSKLFAVIISVILSAVFKGFGTLIFAYGIYSLINIFLKFSP